MRGLCLFYKKDLQTVHIKFLFVDEACRGKGIGKKLLFTALNTFSEIQACTLNTLAYANDAAYSFYKYYDFKQTGLATIDPTYPDTHMGFRLDLKK